MAGKFADYKWKDLKATKGRGGLRAAKDAVRYQHHRPNDAEERQNREGFNAEGPSTKEAAFAMLDDHKAAGQRYAGTLVLNPGEGQAPGDLQGYTRSVMRDMQERGLVKDWHAVEHGNQGSHAHVHIVVTTEKGKWSKADIEALHTSADQRWEQHRSQEAEQHQEHDAKAERRNDYER